MKKSFLFMKLLLFAVFLTSQVHAQVSAYSFSESTETYAQITGTTSTAAGDDGTQTNISIGFSFNFGGTNYTAIGISTNGVIRLGSNATNTTITTGWVNGLSASAANRPLIAPFWEDNNLNTGTIRYTTTGTAPNRVFTVNWHNSRIGGGGSTAGANCSYLVRLNETSNIIEIVYSSPFTTTNTVSASVGLNDMTSFLSVTPAATSTVSGVTANDIISAAVMANLAGKKLTFSPPTCFAPTALINSVLSTTTANHSWSAPSSGTTPAGYEWAVTTSATPPASGTATAGFTASSAGLTPSTTYYLHVRSDCGGGDISGWATSSFFTGYCVPIYAVGKTSGDLISNVTVVGTTLDNPSGTAQVNPAYTFFTGAPNLTGDLAAGTTYTVSVSIGAWGSQAIKAWIDYNDNLIFEPSEVIGQTVIAPGSGFGGPYPAATFPITLSCSPPVGIHRMRIRSVWNVTAASIDPCAAAASGGYGETEDYDVNVLAPPPCPVISSLASNTVTNTTANVTWNAGCIETAWDVEVSNSATPSGTPTDPLVASTTFAASSLTPNTLYYVHVRANCAGSTPAGVGESLWSTTSFTTLPNPPNCVSSTATPDPLCDNQNLVFTWASDPDATSYLFSLGTTPGGNQIANNVSFAGLTTTLFTPLINQTYYWTVVPVGVGGPAVGCVEQSYLTGGTACVCEPVYTNTPTGTSFGDLISAVSITGTALNNNVGFTAGQPDYLDFFNSVLPTQTASMSAGSSYTVNVSTGEWGDQGIRVWIDFNGDNQFDVSESVGSTATVIGSGFTPGVVNASASFNISLPCNPVPGDYRMRVRGVYAVNGPTIDPCNGYTFGQVHDYKVTVLPPPPCPSPTGLAVSGVTVSNATVNWTVGCTETAWDLHISTSATPPGGAPSNPGLVATTYAATGLLGSTVYYAHVRAVCGGGSGNSAWITTSFTTAPANDECSGAVTLVHQASPSCTPTASTLINATSSIPNCASTGNTDVWFSFVATGPVAEFEIVGTSGFLDAVTEVFDGGTCGALGASIACEDPETFSLSGLTTGNTYYVAVNKWSTFSTSQNFTICITSPPPPPANDDCAGAISFGTITATPSCQVVNLESSTIASAPCIGDGLGDVWYSFTVPNTGGPTTQVFYSTTNITGSGDRVFEVFDVCGGFSITCSDLESGSFSLPAGTYRMRTHNFSSFSPAATSFNLCLYLTPVVPSNDNICNALTIRPVSGRSLNTYASWGDFTCSNRITNTQLATGTEALPCVFATSKSVWYRFTTPACVVGGSVPFQIEMTTDNALTSFDTGIQLFTSSDGTCNGTLTSVNCNDDGSSAVTVCGGTNGLTSTIVTTALLPNTNYYVLVSGYNGGSGILEVSGRAISAPHTATSPSPTTVSMTTPNKGAASNLFYVRPVGGPGYSVSATSALTATATVANGASYETQLEYRCTASSNQWYRSPVVTVAVPTTPGCTAVTALNCAPGAVSGYTLSWPEVSGLFTNGGLLSGYILYYQVVGQAGYSVAFNPTPVCSGGTCTLELPSLTNPAGYNFYIKTRCSATVVLTSNITTCAGAKSATNDVFTFVNPTTGTEYHDVKLTDDWGDFGLSFADLGSYFIGINKENEIFATKIGEADMMNFGDDVSFELVPNPTNASTTMTFNNTIKSGTFTVVDALGRTISSGDISNSSAVELDGSKWNAGVYLVNVTTNDKTTMRRLVISK